MNSDKFDRTSFVKLNEIIQSYQWKTNEEENMGIHCVHQDSKKLSQKL